MAARLAGKIAVITGGGSGIGRACALRFVEEGAKVCVADLDLAAATGTARQLGDGGQAMAVEVDTTDEGANDAMIERCTAAFGGVDILVAAAGVAGPRPSESSARPYTVMSIPTERFRGVMNVNLYGVLFSNRAAARVM